MLQKWNNNNNSTGCSQLEELMPDRQPDRPRTSMQWHWMLGAEGSET